MSAMKSACGEYECPCHDEAIKLRADLAAIRERIEALEFNPDPWVRDWARRMLGVLGKEIK